jgi:hypothetical protein
MLHQMDRGDRVVVDRRGLSGDRRGIHSRDRSERPQSAGSDSARHFKEDATERGSHLHPLLETIRRSAWWFAGQVTSMELNETQGKSCKPGRGVFGAGHVHLRAGLPVPLFFLRFCRHLSAAINPRRNMTPVMKSQPPIAKRPNGFGLFGIRIYEAGNLQPAWQKAEALCGASPVE